MFSISDIKPGYLLVFTGPDGKQYKGAIYPVAAFDESWCEPLAYGDLICKTQYCDSLPWFPVASLSEDLTYTQKYGDTYTVDQIFGYTTPGKVTICSTNNRLCLWERKPPKVMTLEQIAAELKCKEVILLQGGQRIPTPLKYPTNNLRPGMMVVLRNSTHCLIVVGARNTMVMDPENPADAQSVGCYKDDLCHYDWSKSELDIMEVWSAASDPIYMLSTAEENRRIQWRRDERYYMTLDQICTELGYLVTIKES